jgi:serine protease Do
MKRISLFVISILYYTIALASPSQAASLAPESFASLVSELMPAVVNISTTQKITRPNTFAGAPQLFPEGSPFEEFNELFERFGLLPPGLEGEDKATKNAVSLGSGFIIDKAGYIVTNHHVIAEADEITVKFSNEKTVKAKVVGTDIKTDLALLKVDVNEPLTFVKFGDSEKINAGDWVIAIGNPFGLGSTVTAGIISAKARDINIGGGLVDNYIQTDAAINKGNSGGPMFNMAGEVIGVNTAIISPSMGNVGIGFALPSSLAQKILNQLKETGKVERGWLGVGLQPVDDEIAESLGQKDTKGALIATVAKDSPAEKAGILPGDIVLSFDGHEISSIRKFSRLVAETPIGKTVDIIVLRKGNKKPLKVTVGEIKEKTETEEEPTQEDNNATKPGKEVMGIIVSKLTPELRHKYSIDNSVTGVAITKILRKGDVIKRALHKGDVIVAANQEEVDSPEALESIVKKAKKANKKSILLLIYRAGMNLFIAVPIK